MASTTMAMSDKDALRVDDCPCMAEWTKEQTVALKLAHQTNDRDVQGDGELQSA